MHSSNPAQSIGNYRYLLFVIQSSFDNKATEYYEIDVVERVIMDYENWTAKFPGFTDTAGTSDPDGDGMNNEAEYAFGLNPTLATSVSPISVTLEPSTGTFEYTRRDPLLTGLPYTVQVSTDLQNWEAAVNPSITPGPLDPESHVQTVTVSVNEVPIDGRLFVRVVAGP